MTERRDGGPGRRDEPRLREGGSDGTRSGGALGVLLDVLSPGLRRLLSGDRRGGLVLALWIGLVLLTVARWERILATLSGGGVGEWVALGTLVLGLAACVRSGLADARPGAGMRGERALERGAGDEARPTPPALGAGEPVAPGALTWRRFARHRYAALGTALLAVLCLSALLTPYVAPHDPTAQERVVETRYQPPSLSHPMGTDRFGRDVLSRVLYGARISLSIGVIAVLIAITLGTLLGAVAGYVGGWTDTLSMRFVDLLLSFPRLVLLIALVALFEPSVALVTHVLGLTGWMGTSRIVRGEVLSLREQEYVEAARALGYGHGRILLRHVLPNALSPVIVAATLGVGNTILVEAALSFLGLGVQPPTPSWGNMVASGRDVMLEAWWITCFPGLAIVLTVMSFNLVGDGLRDALDPRTSAEATFT